ESAPPLIAAAELAEPAPAFNVDDVKIVAEESIMTAAQPDLDAMAPPFQIPAAAPVAAAEPPLAVPVPAWDPPILSQAPRAMESPRFGPLALFLALIVGAVSGFAAGYMARPRALQSGPPQTIAQGASGALGASGASGAAPKAPEAPAPKAPQALQAPQAPQAAEAPKTKPGRLLVRSVPSGANVTVDGVARGETPLAL